MLEGVEFAGQGLGYKAQDWGIEMKGSESRVDGWGCDVWLLALGGGRFMFGTIFEDVGLRV